MHLQESEAPKKGPHRERFFSSMNYEQYSVHFGPPKPLLKPVADPLVEIQELKLDDSDQKIQTDNHKNWQALGFGRSRGVTLPIIKENKALEETSNYDTENKQSLLVEVVQQPDFSKQRFKRSHSRMRSMSQNSNLLILSLLQRAERMQKCSKREQIGGKN